jgi:hypothetical protein
LEKKVTNALNKELEKDELFVNQQAMNIFQQILKSWKCSSLLILRIIKMENWR